MVEYLLLIAAAAITAYLIVSRGPLPGFTREMLGRLRFAMMSITRTAQTRTTEIDYGDKDHPSNKTRFKAVHE